MPYCGITIVFQTSLSIIQVPRAADQWASSMARFVVRFGGWVQMTDCPFPEPVTPLIRSEVPGHLRRMLVSQTPWNLPIAEI